MDGLKAMTEGYHYMMCGLDYVYLENGYTFHETPYGQGVSIEDAEGLDATIAEYIITTHSRLRGQEVRFLRSQLDLSQKGLGRLVGQSRAAVARWESNRTTPIPPAADRALRLYYALKITGHEVAEEIADLLTEIDELEYQAATFQETEDGWMRAAA